MQLMFFLEDTNLNSITCKIVVRTTWGYEKTFFLKLKVREIIYQCSWESLHCLMHPTEIKKVKDSFFIVYKSIKYIDFQPNPVLQFFFKVR